MLGELSSDAFCVCLWRCARSTWNKLDVSQARFRSFRVVCLYWARIVTHLVLNFPRHTSWSIVCVYGERRTVLSLASGWQGAG